MTRSMVSSRRRFLASSSSMLAFTLLAGSVPASPRTSMPQATGCNALVLYRANESQSQKFAGEFALAGYMTRELSDNPVRQWRDELHALVMHHNFMLPGLGNWADFSILRGLAAENRRFPLMLTQHDKYQPAHAEWAIDHAQALLTENCLNNSERLALSAKNLNNKSTINTG